MAESSEMKEAIIMPWQCYPWRLRRSDPCWQPDKQHFRHVGPASVYISCYPCSRPATHQRYALECKHSGWNIIILLNSRLIHQEAFTLQLYYTCSIC